jgi:hypothetical protein
MEALENTALALEEMLRGLGAAPQRIKPADSSSQK